MKLSAQNITSNEPLSVVNTQFLHYVKDHPEGLKRSNFSDVVNDELFPYLDWQPWPMFIKPEMQEEIARVGTGLQKIITSLPKRIFNYDPQKIADYFLLPGNIVKTMSAWIDPESAPNLLARGDFILGPDGFKCLEYNMKSNLGGWQIEFMEPRYKANPFIDDFIKANGVKVRKPRFMDNLFGHLIDSGLVRFDGSNPLNTAFVVPDNDDKNSDIMMTEMMSLRYSAVLKKKGLNPDGKAIFCTLGQVKRKGDFLEVDGVRVHTLVEMLNGLVPPGYAQIIAKGNLVLLNGPISLIMSNKLNLALMSENIGTGMFSSEEDELISQYVPWTRKVFTRETVFMGERVIFPDVLIQNREKLVIKPSIGFGGESVYIGRGMTPDEWAKVVGRAVAMKNWIVQEHIHPRPFLYQYGEGGVAFHDNVFGFFCLGRHYGGAFIRAIAGEGGTRVVNSKMGAEVVVILELMD